MEQTQCVFAKFPIKVKDKNCKQIDFYQKYCTNLTIKYQILAQKRYLLQLLDESSPFIRIIYRLKFC